MGTKPKFSDLASEYATLWSGASINPGSLDAVKQVAATVQANKDKYTPVTEQTGVPWFVVGIIHSLEANFKFTTHLHNGDPLGARTTHEPIGRPLSPPLNDWAHSAVDALTMKGLQNVGADGWTIERIAFELERYNGMGYRMNSLNTLSPYLWSFTNKYVRGKYVADHVYDPSFVSQQAGGMAILKRLIADGVSTEHQGPVPPPGPPPPPVPTGKYQVEGHPFELRSAVNAPPTDQSLVVMRDMPVEKLADTEDAAWWKVEVTLPDQSTQTGFAKKEWLRPILVSQQIKEDFFTQACLDAARRYGTSAHFLVALADAESGIVNKPFDNGPFGPFAMTKEDWTANNNKAETGLGDGDRFNPYSQVEIAARLLVKLVEDLRAQLPDKRLPDSQQLYLGRAATPKGLKAVMDATGASTVRATLETVMAPAEVSQIFELRPPLFPAGVNITVNALRTSIANRIDAGLKRSVTLIQKLEPDLVVGPPETVDEKSEAPWVAKARSQLGVEEIPGSGSNPEVEKFFTATTLGPQPDDTAWCAAFICWCIKQAGGSSKHVNYSARAAADWLQNGDKVSGPQLGVVAVTKPYAATSSGHVGFVVAWDGTRVKLLGGNQKAPNGREAVCEKSFPIGDVRGWRMM